jgi:hypothetical protein
MKNAVVCDVMQCGSSVLQFLVTANVVAISLIPFTLIMEAMLSSENRFLQRHTAYHPRRPHSS